MAPEPGERENSLETGVALGMDLPAEFPPARARC